MHGCPSGLRGQTQALLAKAPWVRIPLHVISFLLVSHYVTGFLLCYWFLIMLPISELVLFNRFSCIYKKLNNSVLKGYIPI